jgi:TonB family protein
MATSPPGGFQEPKENPIIRWAMIGLGLLLAIGLAWFVYTQLTGTLTTKVKVDQKVTAITPMTPPPPPPPPPPKPEEKPPEPTDAPKPTPEPAAAPKPDAPAPMTVAADAQAGTDAFGLQAGSGNGMGGGGAKGTCLKPPCGGGGGFSDALYRGNLARDLQDRILGNDKVNRLAFKAIFAISVNGAGQVTDAQLLSSTGDAKRDQLLLAILKSARGLEPPPSQVRFPQRVTVSGRRSF